MGSWGAMFRTVCQRVRRRGVAVGGYVAVARWETPASLPVDLPDRLFAAHDDHGVVAIDLWRATERQNEASKEAQTRPIADKVISSALIIEATREANMRHAAAALPRLLGVTTPAPSAVGLYRMIALQDAR